MTEKTAGQVAHQARYNWSDDHARAMWETMGRNGREAEERVGAAVIAHHEASKAQVTTGTSDPVEITPEVPAEFYAALDDVRAGRTVPLDVALTTPPPPADPRVGKLTPEDAKRLKMFAETIGMDSMPAWMRDEIEAKAAIHQPLDPPPPVVVSYAQSMKCQLGADPPPPGETPTPRTDAEVLWMWDSEEAEGRSLVVRSRFARTLERELTAARAECERMEDALGKLYWHITDGKLSKPYDFEAIEAEIDDAMTKRAEDHTRDAVRELCGEILAIRNRIPDIEKDGKMRIPCEGTDGHEAEYEVNPLDVIESIDAALAEALAKHAPK